MMDITKETQLTASTGQPMLIIENASPYLGKHAKTPFYFRGIKYKTLSHFIECQKALFLQKYDMFHAFNHSNSINRVNAMAAGMAVDFESWYKKLDEVLSEALFAKFIQNHEAASALVATGSSMIVYADDEDGFLGVGMHRDNPFIGDEVNWPGQNRLGRLMKNVRDSLEKNLDGKA